VIDWFARRILTWRLSITLGVEFCVDAVEEAMHLYGRPEIFNTDQGSQFTSDAFTDILVMNGIAISMDGKGSWRDNVFLERFWLVAYESVAEARLSIRRYPEFYNGRRPHSALDRCTPDQAYYASLRLCA
jgi:putative transposase